MADLGSPRASRSLAPRLVVFAFTAAWLLTPLSTTARARGPVASGTLTVASDPAGAAVYLDGRLAGTTPLTLPATVGDHRVRLVLDGFLEHGRLVGVTGGQSNRLDVKLTKYAGASTLGSPEPPTGGGGSFFGSKWFVLGLVAGGAAGGYEYWKNLNHPPSAGSVTVLPAGNGMAGITQFSFNSIGASDKDGNQLTRNWDFGDGTTGSGSAAVHTYTAAGSYQAKVFVTDGKKSVTGPTTTVTVGPTMAATWTGGTDPLYGLVVTFTLTQSGSDLAGNFRNSLFLGGPGIGLAKASVSTLSYPTAVNITTTVYGFTQAGHFGQLNFADLCMHNFSGNTDTTGATMSGTLTTTCALQGVFAATVTFHR